MSEYLQNFLRSSRGVSGIYSVCSAHPWVIEAAMRQAIADHSHLLIEATCNQVNQAGGYTGMTPAMFRSYVYGIAGQLQFDVSRLIFGGDHLGPNPWQALDAATAMQNAAEMVRLYVEAGFTKIHLDTSMRCADDPAVLPDEAMAMRAASLCKVAEDACAKSSGGRPIYVIGTEVPVPGGAAHSLNQLEVTRYEAAEQTLAVHRKAFLDAGLGAAYERVIALVVQPGVEFDHDSVIDYDSQKAVHLQRFLQAHPSLVMEAHSTDYQLPHAYQELIRDGFAILKVGPALTFALREALYALSATEKETVPVGKRACLPETMEKAMLAHPSDWQKYYRGTHQEQRRLRVYSYSDRLRYYWKFPEVEIAVKQLIQNFEERPIPETLLSQYCPRQYDLVRAGKLKNEPRELVIANVMSVLDVYSKACLTRL